MTAETTMSVPKVYGAISDVMAQMAKSGISKGRRNQQQGYSFRGIDDVYNSLASVLAENRIVMLPFVQDMKREERQTKQGGTLNYTILTVDFTIVCAVDASQAIVRTIGEAMDSADKSSNKAQSAALKYAALEVFMIPTEGDNDADATTHDVAPRHDPTPEPAITDAQRQELMTLAVAKNIDAKTLCEVGGINSIKEMPAGMFVQAKTWIAKQKKRDPGPTEGAPSTDILDDEVPY